DVQRVLPSVPDSERGARRPEALACRGCVVRARAAHARAGSDGHRSAHANVMAVIGITQCRKLEDYRQAVLHVGGTPTILDPSMTAEQALSGVDGLLLTGGDDVAPSRYGEAPHAATVEAEKWRDEFEIALIAAARARQLPIFAICRGIQVLNVACGGTLVQDIPSQIAGALTHSL